MSQKQNKAYENLDFLRSRDARGIRILCEYLEPLQQFQRMGVRETIVIFGSARAKPIETLEAEFQKLNAEKKKYKGSLPAKLSQRLERMHWERKLSAFYEQSAELAPGRRKLESPPPRRSLPPGDVGRATGRVRR